MRVPRCVGAQRRLLLKYHLLLVVIYKNKGRGSYLEDHFNKLVTNQLLDILDQEIHGFVKVLQRLGENCWFVD